MFPNRVRMDRDTPSPEPLSIYLLITYSFIHSFMYVYCSPQKGALLHVGKNVRSSSTEPHADRRPTYNGVHMGLMMLGRKLQTAEPLVPESSAREFETAIEKLKRHKSPGSDQIPAKLIKARGMTICSEIHKLMNSIWNKGNCLRNERCRSLYLFIVSVIKQIVAIMEEYNFFPLHTKFYPASCCLG